MAAAQQEGLPQHDARTQDTLAGAYSAAGNAGPQYLGAAATFGPAAASGDDEATRRLLSGVLSARPAAGTGGAMALVQDSATRRLLYDDVEKRGASREGRRAAERTDAEATCFRVVLHGEIESCQLGAGSRGPLMCVFTVQHGADWTIVSGAPNGITQLACASIPPATSLASALFRTGDSREVVWNFPIGLVFKSTSPFGWPRLVVTVYGTDLCNRRVVKGYGSLHIPCQPGRHSRTIRLYCPLSSSPFTRLFGTLFGNPAQFVDPRIITGTEGREVVRVQSGGKVRVQLEVLLKDTAVFNYVF